MLDRLPTELLLRTLELAAPLEYTPSLYLDRRNLLRVCCLVSKNLREIAQPMLPEVYEIREVQDLEVLEAVENGEKRGRKVKVLALQSLSTYDEEDEPSKPFLTLAQLVALTPAVFDVRLVGGEGFDLSVLARLPCAFPLSIREPHS